MYVAGGGVPKDPIQAHMWFNLAAANMVPGAGRKQAVANRMMIEAKLSSTEISRAQAMARNWQPKAKEVSDDAAGPAG